MMLKLRCFLQNYGALYAVFIFFIVCAFAATVITYSTTIIFCFGGGALMVWSLLIKRREFIDTYFIKLDWKLMIHIVLVWLYYFVLFLLSSSKEFVYMSMIVLTLGCLLTGTIVLFANTKERLYFLIKILSIFFVANIFIGICQSFLPFNLVVHGDEARFIFEYIKASYSPKGLFYNENAYMAFLVGYFPLFLYRHRKKMLWNIIIASMLVFLCMTSRARAGYITLLCFGIIFGGHASIALIFKKIKVQAWAKDVTLLIFILLLPYGIRSLPDQITKFIPSLSIKIQEVTPTRVMGSVLHFFSFEENKIADNSDSKRIIVLKHALSKWSKNAKTIIFGLGFGQSRFLDSDVALKIPDRLPGDQFFLHNAPLEMLTEGGLLLFGYVLFLVIISLVKYHGVLQRIKLIDMDYANVCRGILYAILLHVLAGTTSLYSLVFKYRDLFLFLGLFLCVLNFNSKKKLVS